MFPSRPAEASGALLNERYRLDRLLGEGATSRVYSAQDTWLDRMVAVKVLRGVPDVASSPMGEQLAKEARALARLSHPNVVTLHDVGLTRDGVAFLVMALAPDGTLEQELDRRGTLPPDELLALMLPVIGALACAHRHGVIHRDLKPGNLALERAASGHYTVKVLDFGIAKMRALDSNAHQILGTPAYMAPEQVRGETLGPHTDVWAVGVILFRALSGRLPYEAEGTATLLYRIANERAPQLSSLRPDVGGRLALAIDRALEPDLRLRYESMEALARALAVAARQDGLVLPNNPEPSGLPHFGAWLAEADVSATTPLTEPLAPQVRATDLQPNIENLPTLAAPPAPTVPPAPQTPTRSPSRWALPIGLVLLVAIGWGARHLVTSSETTTTLPVPRDVSESDLPQTPRAELSSSAPPMAEVLSAPAATTDEPDASVTREPAIRAAEAAPQSDGNEPPRVRPRRRRARALETSVPPPSTRQQIVKQWDW